MTPVRTEQYPSPANPTDWVPRAIEGGGWVSGSGLATILGSLDNSLTLGLNRLIRIGLKKAGPDE